MKTSLAFDAKAFTSARQPVVYGWRRGVEYLYIGASTVGLSRIIGKHHVIGKADTVLPDDVIESFEIGEDQNVFEVERQMIRKHAPRFNRSGGGRRRKGVARFEVAKGKVEIVVREETLRTKLSRAIAALTIGGVIKVETKSDRVTAMQISETLFAVGVVNFRVETKKLEGGGYEILAVASANH